MFDLKSDVQAAVAIGATLSGTTPSKGNIVDMQGFRSLTFALQTGAVTDAGTTAGFGFEVQESDNTADAAFTAVADADLIGLESALTVTSDTHDNKPIGTIGYRGIKRYVRIVATGTTATDAVVFGQAIKGHPLVGPCTATADNIAAT